MIFAAALAFALSALMYGFGWSSGHVTYVLLALIGLLCLALSGAPWGWLHARRRGE